MIDPTDRTELSLYTDSFGVCSAPRRAFWPRRWAPGDVEELLRKAKALNMNLSPYFDRLTWVTGSNLHSQPEEQLA